MNIIDLQSAIELCHVANVPIFAWGAKGLGKSTAPKAYASTHFHFYDENGKGSVPYGYKTCYAAQMEASDIRGLPKDDLENGCTVYLPPKDLPLAEFINEDGVLFGRPGDEMPKEHLGKKVARYRGIINFDELNRAEDDVIQAIFQIVTEKACGGYTMPTGWGLMATGNQSGAKYRVNSMVKDAAFISRFAHVTISVDDTYRAGWINFIHSLAESESTIAEGITQFCCFKDEHLFIADEEVEDLVVEPNPRGWEYVLRVELAAKKLQINDTIRRRIICGLVGMSVASAYCEFNAPVTPQQILERGVTDAMAKILEDDDKVSRGAIQAILHGLASKAGKIADPNSKQITNVFSFGRWLMNNGDHYRDLAVAFFRALTGKEFESKQSLKGVSMINESLRKIILQQKQAGPWYNALAEDKPLYDLLSKTAYGPS